MSSAPRRVQDAIHLAEALFRERQVAKSEAHGHGIEDARRKAELLGVAPDEEDPPPRRPRRARARPIMAALKSVTSAKPSGAVARAARTARPAVRRRGRNRAEAQEGDRSPPPARVQADAEDGVR